MCTLNIVTEREERVRAQCHTGHLIQPCTLLLLGEYRRFYLKGLLPYAVSQHIHVLVTDVNVNGVITVSTLDAVHKLQVQHLRSLAQEPVVCLLACQSGAVYAGLLSCADTDGLTVLCVADGVGLGVL